MWRSDHSPDAHLLRPRNNSPGPSAQANSRESPRNNFNTLILLLFRSIATAFCDVCNKR